MPCPTCSRLKKTAEALGEKGGPPFCPDCGERVFTSALKKRSPDAVEPEARVVEGEFERPSTDLAHPKMTAAEFLRRLANDLDAGRAQTVGTDFSFERLRIRGPGYDLFIGRYDPDRHHPWRRPR
jgi:hypothetical protein